VIGLSQLVEWTV